MSKDTLYAEPTMSERWQSDTNEWMRNNRHLVAEQERIAFEGVC